MKTITLGCCDLGKAPRDKKKYLEPFHYLGVLAGTNKFRDDDRSKWRSFSELPGEQVKDLQSFLIDAGFYPRGTIDGIYGYGAEASARLFQEYVRSIEGHADVVPDGIIGPGTWAHIHRWKAEGKVSEWGRYTYTNPSSEFSQWIQFLNDTKAYYLQNGHPILDLVNHHNKKSDTVKVKDWDFSPDETHLIGIRSHQGLSQTRRVNDDIFVLLINGMVFKFWGSTDPNPAMTSRSDEAFLVEGQHKYKYGWHKVSVEAKVYRAMKPYKNGVLVFRDRDSDNALTEVDVSRGLDANPNNTINIHWSGIGSTNFSAGCQVIAGKSYINHNNKAIDCSSFAARSYSTLTDAGRKTKGAYNVFFDLVVAYSKPDSYHILYTLGRESTLKLDDGFGADYVKDCLERMGV